MVEVRLGLDTIDFISIILNVAYYVILQQNVVR